MSASSIVDFFDMIVNPVLEHRLILYVRLKGGAIMYVTSDYLALVLGT